MASYNSKITEYCKANGINKVNFPFDVELTDANNDGNIVITKWNLNIPQPTLEQIDSYETIANQTEANYVDPKSTGNQKLLDLGLTQAEATALTGYTPPTEV
tara:strand:+ start:1010 stop:1315 length:306 start_codon:yes stop_codon:yes gene_type:complete